MKIGKITASLHRHEIDLPNIGKSIESRMFVFVEVETDDGLKGFGITGSILPWAVIACIEHHLAPALKGRDVLHTEEIHSHVWRKLNSRDVHGRDLERAIGHRRRALGHPGQEGEPIDP